MDCKNWGFCDLAVSRSFDLTKLEIFEKCGFTSIAIDTHVLEPSDEPKKKKKKGEVKELKDIIPAPVEIPLSITQKTKLNILQRVTVEFSDSSITPQLNQSQNYKKYDIIAVVPKTLQAFQYACGTFDADIITFDPVTRIPFKISRKLYRQAAERGLFFELMYSPAIRDSTCRKNIISTAHTYHAVGRSKNIIVTSCAENCSQVRDVHDVINLGFILGLKSNQSLEVVKDNARRLILKSKGRRSGKLYVGVTKVEEEIK
ncbi:hypothetical protein O0L34_g4315 [Tuta absoluta]|nr:hypothetical protein O0L34_g4315 [Tuta absoluta]